MTMFVAVIAGLATWLVASIVLAFCQGYVRGMGGTGTVLLAHQPWKLLIQIACWFAAVWAGMSVFTLVAG